MSGRFKRVQTAENASAAKLVVIIDDDPLALEAIGGLLRSWGFRVVTAASDNAALAQLAELRQSPHLIICDYHLSEGKTGIEAIERLRNAFEIPAFLISGDAAPAHIREAHARGYHLLHKPVNPKTLRAMLNLVLEDIARPER
jgi:two-component system OmpR family response regulator